MKYEYNPKGVCPMKISFDIEGDVISHIEFLGGCHGNLKAISKLVDGWKAEDIEKALAGNTCGMKKTSCADQLAAAVRQAREEVTA